MTDEELAAIRGRAEKATPGPWKTRDLPQKVGLSVATIHSPHGDSSTVWDGTIDLELAGVNSATDADFISHARTDVPALVAEVVRLQGIIKQVREWAQNEQGESDRAAHRAMDAATVSVEKSELREARVRSQESSVVLHILDGEDK